MEQDNTIYWIFEKAFDQLTINGMEIYQSPFDLIKNKTFLNNQLYLLINKLSKKSIDLIKLYLTNTIIQEKFLFTKTKKKLHVQILLNDLNKIKELVNNGYVIDHECLNLAVLNNRKNILEYFIEISNIKLSNEILMTCVEFGYEDMYFYLIKNNLIVNISIYHKAVIGGSLAIVKHISEKIGLSFKTLKEAFQANHTDVIIYLCEVANKENIKINADLINYSIMNNNMHLVKYFNDKNIINWETTMYYSAVLSGSIEMVQYLELMMPNIHDNYALDHGYTRKGQMSLLLQDIIYQIQGKNYFSHTINYAIQSGSIDMLKYIHQKGYLITVSNFITALKQGTVEMVKYLSKSYTNPLPFYLIHYLGPFSYLSNKSIKAKILYQAGLLDLDLPIKMSINDYKKENTHLKMILDNNIITEDSSHDTDFLMKYHLFLIPAKGFKLNFSLITRTRLCLELCLNEKLDKIFNNIKNNVDRQYLIDILFLFGNLAQIVKYYPLISTDLPSIQILMELMCYRQMEKLGYLYQKKLLSSNIMEKLYPVAVMLSDSCINLLFNKMLNDSTLKYLLLSGKKDLILEWTKSYPKIVLIDKDTIKQLCLTDDVEIVKNFCIEPFSGLDKWLEENDLLEIKKLIY